MELTRTVARRFNDRYCPGRPYFTAPDALLSDVPLLLGTDGQKMSKSRGNAIALAASEDETARLIRTARTDDQRTITYQPESRPAVSNLVRLAALCLETSPEEVAAGLDGGGAAALKRLLTEALNERLRPIRARRREVAADPGYLRQVLADGNERVACPGRADPLRGPDPHAHPLLTGLGPVRRRGGGWAGRFPRRSRRGGG